MGSEIQEMERRLRSSRHVCCQSLAFTASSVTLIRRETRTATKSVGAAACGCLTGIKGTTAEWLNDINDEHGATDKLLFFFFFHFIVTIAIINLNVLAVVREHGHDHNHDRHHGEIGR